MICQAFMSHKQFPIEAIKNKIKDILSEPKIQFCGLNWMDYKL